MIDGMWSRLEALNRHCLCSRQLMSPMNVSDAIESDRTRVLVMNPVSERDSEPRRSFGR